MTNDDPDTLQLKPHFDALRQEMQFVAAPDALENAMMAAFRRAQRKTPWYRRLARFKWRLAGGAGSAAVLAMVLVLALHAPAPPDEAAAPAAASHDANVDFVAIESRERIEQEPDARVVQADVPRTMLDALGVPATPENAGDSVRAELLVGADGAPLAVRFLSK